VGLPLAYEIVNIYNAERSAIVGSHRELSPTPAVMRDASKVAAFVRRHNLDPRLWIRSQFAARRGRHSVRLSSMASEKSLARHHEFGAENAARDLSQAVLSARCQADISRDGVEVTHLSEAAKRALVATPDVCMASSATLTLGWNPRSKICGTCRMAVRCKLTLPSHISGKRESDARRSSIRV